MSAYFAILACCLLIINMKCVDAVYNNLRQGSLQQQQQQSDKVDPIVSTDNKDNNCLEDQWHISIEHPTTCTNSQIFPSQWTKSSVRDYLFHSTPEKCCGDVMEVSDTCNIINTCHTNNNPETKEAALGRSLISTKCTKTKWHISTVTLYACTNDYNYPSAWDLSPANNLFNSAEECCSVKYPSGGCSAIDTCPTPTPTPPPTAQPTTPMPSSRPSTEPPAWYVDRSISKCVMDCINEPNRPCGGYNQWEPTFLTVEECCDSINWIPLGECMSVTASPASSPPPNAIEDAVLLEEDDDMDAEGNQTHFDWYKDLVTMKCVQDCEDEYGKACGGIGGGAVTEYYSTVEECCASIPWKEYDECATTAGPTTSTPTTSFPPTVSPRPTVSFPPTVTPKPTYKPTFECPDTPEWYLYKSGSTAECINDATYYDNQDDTTDIPVIFPEVFDSADACCNSRFVADGDTCKSINVCEVKYFADYTNGWDEGSCLAAADPMEIPTGRRTFSTPIDCCNGAFLGQSSGTCLSVANAPAPLLGDPGMQYHWYRDRLTFNCVQDCEIELNNMGLGYSCGGLAQQFEQRFNTVEECCATVPWKPFEICSTNPKWDP